MLIYHELVLFMCWFIYCRCTYEALKHVVLIKRFFFFCFCVVDEVKLGFWAFYLNFFLDLTKQSAICTLEDVDVIKEGKVSITSMIERAVYAEIAPCVGSISRF